MTDGSPPPREAQERLIVIASWAYQDSNLGPLPRGGTCRTSHSHAHGLCRGFGLSLVLGLFENHDSQPASVVLSPPITEHCGDLGDVSDALLAEQHTDDREVSFAVAVGFLDRPRNATAYRWLTTVDSGGIVRP